MDCLVAGANFLLKVEVTWNIASLIGRYLVLDTFVWLFIDI